MKKKMLKSLSVFLVVLVVLSIAPLNTAVVEVLKSSSNNAINNIGTALSNIEITLPDFTLEANAFISNKKEETGEVNWSYTNGVITLSGKGEMPVYSKEDRPWLMYKDSCEKIVVKGYLKSISKDAFCGFTNLKTIEIVGSLEKIGNNAFAECTSLENVIFSSALKEIGYTAFLNCTSLKNVDLPEGLLVIKSAFAGCTGLEEIVIPETVTTLSCTFNNCTNLKQVNLPSSLETIGANTFRNCPCFDGKELVIPDTVTTIGEGAFSGCDITSLTTPFVGTTSIKDEENESALNFIGCMFGTDETENAYKVSLSKVGYYIPASLKSVTVTRYLDEYNFYGMKGLEKLTISDGVEATYFPRNFALGCKALKELEYGALKNFEGIGADAFRECSSLESFVIPENSKWIGVRAFYNCTNLKNITFPAGDFYARAYAFDGTRYLSENTSEFIIEGDGVLIQYTGENTSVVVPDGVKRISCAFYKRDDITDITLPDGLLYITTESFYGCSNITELVIPDTVVKMQENSLRGLCSLKKLSIPFVGSSRTVGSRNWDSTIGYLFGQCSVCNNHKCANRKMRFSVNQLYREYSVPKNLVEITINGGMLRENCLKILKTIPTVNLGPNITMIESECLASLGIVNLNFSSTILATSIGSYAFKDNKITSVTIPEGVKKLGCSIFFGNDIKTLVLNDDLEEIYDSFMGLNISSLLLPKGLKRILGSPFSGCENIKVLYIPENVEEIDGSAISSSCLQKIVVDKNNKHFLSDNGILYTIDGKFYAYPPKKTETVFKIGPKVTGFEPEKLADFNVEVKAFVVDEENKNLKSIDGVLYNKDVTTLISYPKNRYAKEYVGPKTLTRVAGYAFKDASNLESVKFVSNVVLEENCFYRADFKALETSDIPFALTKYFGAYQEFAEEDKAMCESLKSLVLTNQTSDIADDFIYGASLDKLVIKGSLKSIGENAFKNCQINEFVMPDSVLVVKAAAFSQCAKLETLRFSNNLTTIGNEAFYGCPLKLLEFPVSLISIGDWAFAFVEAEYIELPDYIKTVGKCAFGGSRVKKAVINEKLVDISEEIFQNCTNLQVVVLGGNVEKIEAAAFENCDSLETIVIPDKVNSIAGSAFTNANEELVIYCNEGSYAQTFATNNSMKYTTLVLSAIPNQSYTGKAIEPQVSVSANGKELALDSQYKLTFTDNINVGTAKLTARGLGDFKHLIAKGQFEILPRQLSDVVIIYNDFTYYQPTGTKISLNLYAEDNKLTEGEDYEILNWNAGKGVGIYNVTLKGINNIYGTYNFTVEVLPRSITVTKITKSGDFKVTDSKYTLVEGVDYNVEVRTDEKGNEKTCFVGIGNYTDEKMYSESQTDSTSFISVIMNLLSKLLSSLFNIF